MNQVIQLKSSQDTSVNFVRQHADGGYFESRYVQRSKDYFIVYLSSQTGCNMSCRFCHLTATKQTTMTDATLDDFIEQAKPAIAHYRALLADGMEPAEFMHFNFMSRGEPLKNHVLQVIPHILFDQLKALVEEFGIRADFKISTIIPAGTDPEVIRNISSYPGVMIYYSLYSLDPKFRKRWLPKSMNPMEALDALALAAADRPVAIHWAFIAGENDSVDGVKDIVSAVSERKLMVKYNVVRYNPFSDAHGQESNEQLIQDLFGLMLEGSHPDMRHSSRVVPRVGFDVKASCGMFVTGVTN